MTPTEPTISAGHALAGALWKSTDDGWLSYNIETGETLLLSHLARFVIDQLGASPTALTLTTLTDRVHAEEPDFSRADCDSAVAQAIEALQRAQLLTVTAGTMPSP